MTIQGIYDILDACAPFSLQESYDKSGLLVGDPERTVRRVLLTLDITVPVVAEAAECGADLILAHHPVIWDPLRSVSPAHPVWHLIRHNIGAICAHTCIDIAEGGLNDYIGDMMSNQIPMSREWGPLAALSGGRTLGRVAALQEEWAADELAEVLRDVFDCVSLRYCEGRNAQNIQKIAWCSGSGGDLIADAAAAGADALLPATANTASGLMRRTVISRCLTAVTLRRRFRWLICLQRFSATVRRKSRPSSPRREQFRFSQASDLKAAPFL